MQLITYKEELLHHQAHTAEERGEDLVTEELNVDEEDSLYDDTPRSQSKADLEESLLNNTKLEYSQLSGNRSQRSMLQKCPCGLSDRTSSYITCANCSQDWHNKCCNLKGVTAGAIKKLDEWECPRCYVCPHVDIKINVTDTAPWEESEGYRSLAQGITRMEAYQKDKLEEHSRQQDKLVKT